MWLLTGEQMAEVERWATRRQKLSVQTLIQRAAAAVARRAEELAPSGPVVVVSGKGKNGSDGRVAAGLLADKGIEVRLIDLADEAAGGDSDARLAEALKGAALVVDAIFGFSLHGAPRAPADRAIAAIRAAADGGVPVLSVDVPSGVEAHSGHVHGQAVLATETLTFTTPKLGLAIEPGRSYAGRVAVADIGLDPERVAREGTVYTPERADLAAMLVPRPADLHKKQAGRVLVVAGSQGMSGAACLVAEAALRSGAGTVEVAVPASLVGVLETKLTETITIPLPETFARSVDLTALDLVLDLLPGFDVLALGPGLSLDDATVAFVRALVPAAPLPLVLDADGLNAVVGVADLIAARQDPTIITPHPGELARLMAATTAEIQHDRLGFAHRAAQELGAIVVLKGAASLTTDGALTAVNTTGNPGMATMGAGDVLTGLVAGFAAQRLDPMDAAVLATWVHGAAGDEAARLLSQYCVVASDIVAALPHVMLDLVEGGVDGPDRQ